MAQVGCSNAKDTLQCLREVPFATLNSALNGTDGSSSYSFGPVVDGDFVQKWGSIQLDNHEFVKVPVLAGTNTDEGTAFGPTGINTTQEWYDYLTGMSMFPPSGLYRGYDQFNILNILVVVIRRIIGGSNFILHRQPDPKALP